MSNYLHYHQDRLVFIRDQDDAVLYFDTVANFAIDHGSPFPALPTIRGTRAAQLECSDGAVYCWDAKGNELDVGGSVDPAPYLGMIAALPQLQVAKAARTAPPPPPPPDPRLVAIDSNIGTVTIGAVVPKTPAELKAMTLAEYSTWFDANFSTAALLIGLLKRLTLVVIRRVL